MVTRRQRTPRRLIQWGGILLIACLAGAIGCERPVDNFELLAGSSFAQVVYPVEATGEAPAKDASTRDSDEGYYFYVLTDAVGMDVSSPETLLTTLHKHPRGDKNDHSVGHSWMILESPTRLMECGHTGEFGIVKPTYYSGVMARMKEGAPNPIAYLWEEMPDGQFHRGPGSHQPTFVARFPISRAQYDAIYSYVDSYDYDAFSLTDHACTDFVAGGAECAGILIIHRVKLDIPETMVFRGRTVRLRTDEQWRVLSIPSPDLLESHLRRVVDEGAADDATQWYFE